MTEKNNDDMGAVTRLLGNGWAGLAEANETTNEQQQTAALERYRIASEIAAPFMTPAGKICLQRLRELSIDQPTWPSQGVGSFHDAAAYGFAREGQNSFFRHILSCIAVAEEGPPARAGDPAKPSTKRRPAKVVPT